MIKHAGNSAIICKSKLHVSRPNLHRNTFKLHTSVADAGYGMSTLIHNAL